MFAELSGAPPTVAVGCRSLYPRSASVGLSRVALVLLTLFLLYTAVTVLLRVFGEETVTMDTLSAALCVYLLMGYTWGSLYGLMYTFAPGAFHLPMGWPPAEEQGIARDVPLNLLTYFSFMTLTTVGYGDVLPISGSVRAAVIVEAVLGHFYLAVLVVTVFVGLAD